MDQFSDMAQPSILTTTYLEEFLGCFLLLEGDEAKVFGRAVFAAVHGPLDLDHGAVLRKVLLDLLFGDGIVELAHVNLTGL